jgi:UDP-N-acetylglucosamine 2-epimerase (non-hydrolysing)
MKTILSVVGARPNFMKIAPIDRALRPYARDLQHQICHTGQHYDERMSKVFFADLGLPAPDFHLGVGSGSHAEQTARIMVEFEKVVLADRPDLVLVVGDVNSTVACSLVAAKLQIPVGHVEAGLRSWDRTMPEEINRIVTDSLADFLFVTEQSGLDNLSREGVAPEKVHFVGNVMIDSLAQHLEKAQSSAILKTLALERGTYVVVTLHRPSNVDSFEGLQGTVTLLNTLASHRRVIFPVHPRTLKSLEQLGLRSKFSSNITALEPVGYIDFLALIEHADLILTDSGGIQEESTYLGVQCVTLRPNTERPITVSMGTNHLVGVDLEHALEVCLKILGGERKHGAVPPLWDGKSAERIAAILHASLAGNGKASSS